MGSKIPRELTRERERRAWALRCRCWTQARIAEELGVSQQAVSKMLARSEARALRRLSAQIERTKARQTLQLEHLADLALQEFARSQAPRRRTTTEDGPGRPSRTQISEQPGNPRFLAEVRAALGEIRRIWGLDRPRSAPGPDEETVADVTLQLHAAGLLPAPEDPAGPAAE